MRLNKTIILATGGTGGHLFTALALAEELKHSEADIHLITDARCAKYLKSDEPVKTHIFQFHLKMNSVINKVFSLFHLIKICIKTLYLTWKLKPDLVVGFGGYTSFPTMMAAKLLRVAYIIHEQNCFLGKTNRFFANGAKVVALSYKETANVSLLSKEKLVFTGDVVRQSIRNLPVRNDYSSKKFRLFIFGGSQGAKIFSDIIPKTIEEVLNLRPKLELHITQQSSEDDHAKLDMIYNKLGIEHVLSPFFHNMAEIYAKNDLVISRSGAGTIAELTYAGVPAIFIPFPYSIEDHQYYNAKALEDGGAGWCFRQEDISPKILAQKILELIDNPEILKQTSKNIIARQSNGAKHLADTVLKIIA